MSEYLIPIILSGLILPLLVYAIKCLTEFLLNLKVTVKEIERKIVSFSNDLSHIREELKEINKTVNKIIVKLETMERKREKI